MTDNNEPLDIEELDSLLEAERAALIKGDLTALADLLPSKEALIGQLTDARPDELVALKALDGKVRRNQLLLDGALEGIREVADRMAVLNRTRNGLETYGSDGQRQNINVRIDHTLERRA